MFETGLGGVFGAAGGFETFGGCLRAFELHVPSPLVAQLPFPPPWRTVRQLGGVCTLSAPSLILKAPGAVVLSKERTPGNGCCDFPCCGAVFGTPESHRSVGKTCATLAGYLGATESALLFCGANKKWTPRADNMVSPYFEGAETISSLGFPLFQHSRRVLG